MPTLALSLSRYFVIHCSASEQHLGAFSNAKSYWMRLSMSLSWTDCPLFLLQFHYISCTYTRRQCLILTGSFSGQMLAISYFLAKIAAKTTPHQRAFCSSMFDRRVEQGTDRYDLCSRFPNPGGAVSLRPKLRQT